MPGSATIEKSAERIAKAENLAITLQDMLATTLSVNSRRAVWTLVDKVLNKALDFDARVLHPEVFSIFALRLDDAVRKTTTYCEKFFDITNLIKKCFRPNMVAVTQKLVEFRWQRDEVF